jgi:hypothetical protein
MNIDKKYLLSWQSQMLGPHSVEEIKSLLNERKIHSLFKVQSDEGEVLVREFLAGLNDDRKRASAAQAEASVTQPEAAVIEAIAYDERRQAASEKTLPPLPTSLLADESVSPPPLHTGGEAKFGFAMASFVLSLLFVLPFINLVSWVMSLIFGHMFLYASKGDRTHRGYAYAWCGVWLTYIFGAFYLITCFSFAIAVSSRPFIRIEDWLPVIHGLMIGGAIAASVVSGLLIAGTKMITGAAPKTGVAFVAGTLGVMAGLTLQFLVGLVAPEAVATTNTALLVNLSVGVVVFLIQALAWSEMIRVREEEKLGFGRAMIVSLFCTVCQLFLIFVLFLFTKMFA